MNKKEFQRQLIQRYVNNQATEEELEAFFHLLESDEIDEELLAIMEEEAAKEPIVVKKRKLWPRIAAAASILLAISFGGYFLLHKPKQHQQTAQNQKHDIAPGRDQATLTLANGQKIILTKGMMGKLANDITIDSNAVKYQTAEKIEYNTLTTKRGEASPYPLVLADGTKVWLNAASSVTFPTAFNDKERVVTITGEAYFEVVHNARQPFKVKAGNQTIEDIGTSFDVNAYTDEPLTKATLIDGIIRVNGTTLKPGQQFDGKQIKTVNTAEVTAWKDHMFRFNDETLEEIMRQAARWYDVDVKYENESLKTKRFGTIVKRYATASEFMHVLQLTGELKFSIEGKQITIHQP